ncbi:MAG: DUF1638 domain-containing protein [Candidatus Nanopelagicaceae bacterium]|nr:DUF1638 domain-containing protein [Candidatus Nanopelagicaceae bacterium]
MSVGIVACGAIATHISSVKEKFGLDITIYPLPPLLHNSPNRIAGEVESLLTEIKFRHEKCAVAYADCGTYGSLDEVILQHKVSRLGGDHCYEVFAGKKEIEEIIAATPGTYFLTDFLVKSFYRSVVVELGLDKRPELRDDYFRNYESVVWLAQNPTEELEEEARAAAKLIGHPLTIKIVGEEKLAKEILRLVVD